jgi:hypothetical protein
MARVSEETYNFVKDYKKEWLWKLLTLAMIKLKQWK